MCQDLCPHDKPLHRFLRVGPLVEDEFKGMFQYKRLSLLCFHCGCLGHLQGECRQPIPKYVSNKIWHGSWMTAGSLACTSIVWMMTKEELMKKLHEATMLNLLIEPSQHMPLHGAGPYAPRQNPTM